MDDLSVQVGKDAGIVAPIFILGVHKSGTTLIRNLLDGHPELYVVPIEVHYPHCAGLSNAYPNRRSILPGPPGKEARISRMLNVILEYDATDHTMADAYLPGRFDRSRFISYLDKHLEEPDDVRDLLHYVNAIAISLGISQVRSGERIVEKSVDNIEHAWWLRSLYPDARFIYIVRDPYSNFVSFRKYVTSSKGFPSVVLPLRTIEYGLHHAVLFKRALPNLHLIKYEDLITRPEHQMHQVAAFLGIEWNEILMEPTSLGTAWQGNSSSGRKMKGVSAVDLEKWKQQIQPFELDLIARSSLITLMKEFGYQHMGPGAPWRPAYREGLKTYLRNRFYRYFADGS